MVITIFRSRLRPEHHEQYELWAARMENLASGMPGFISIKTYTAQDGERASIVEFLSEETLVAWRDQPDHRQAQELRKKSFYSEYRIQVCQPVRDYRFPKK